MSQTERDTALAELQQKYEQALPDKLQLIQGHWDNLCQVNWSEKSLGAIHHLVHQFAGNGKNFGFEQLSQQARELELMLLPLVESQLPPSAHEKATLDRKIKLLHAAAHKRQEFKPFASLEPRKNQQIRLYVVDDDPVSQTYFELVLVELGYEVKTFQYLKDLYQALETEVPDLVIVDVVLSEGKLAGIEAIRKIRSLCAGPIPVIVISARTDFVAKLRAVREGANAFLIKPISEIPILENTIKECLAERKSAPSKVLVIDDDPYLAEKMVHLLQEANYQARALLNPAEVFKALDAELPDAILLDYHMPHCSGLEVATMLRQDERYLAIPVIFISTENSLEIHQKAVSVTGNEFLLKPVDPEKLLGLLAKAIQKSARVRSKINSISRYKIGTSLLNKQYFFSELEALIASAQEMEQSHYLGYLSIDKPDYQRQRLGWSGIANVTEQLYQWLANTLGNGNYVTQLGDHTFLILTRLYSPLEVQSFFNTLVERVAEHPFAVLQTSVNLTLSASYYRLTQQTRNIDNALTIAAEGALEASKNGGNQTLSWPPSQTRPASVDAPLEASIKEAIAQKAFHLVYQPIVNLDTNENFFEALVRMEDSQKKLILPGQFLPYIHQKGLHFELDRWVLEHALEALKIQGEQEKRELTLFVKLSPIDTNLNRYIPFLSNVLRDNVFRGNQKLYLEITEDWAIKNQDRIVQNIQDLRLLKCGFVLDRVGQSEFSEDLVQHLKPDFVRLDTSLIRSFEADENQKERIEALVKTAHANKIHVIAGTVESATTFVKLWEMDIRYFQGYFVQQPGHDMIYDAQL